MIKKVTKCDRVSQGFYVCLNGTGVQLSLTPTSELIFSIGGIGLERLTRLIAGYVALLRRPEETLLGTLRTWKACKD